MLNGYDEWLSMVECINFGKKHTILHRGNFCELQDVVNEISKNRDYNISSRNSQTFRFRDVRSCS